MTVTIYHNPSCGTSRSVLAILRERGLEPEVIEYLKTPLSRDELQALLSRLGMSVRDMLRWKQKHLVSELGLEGKSDAALLDAMAQHPILMNRPIVVTPKGAKLCRPSETVHELL
ncbi:arsenate reductase [Rhizomicrobium sp. SCGC AG-212-E05]|nr:arsenate reductase [Rhizomicrobium sp. SCGC AG-212-E05]